jgi:hypothetical protein
MSLLFALKAAVKGTTGPRAILMYGLGRTKQRRRQSGQRTNAENSHAAKAVARARPSPLMSRNRRGAGGFRA